MSDRTYVGSLEQNGETLHVYRSRYKVSGRDALLIEDDMGVPYLRASVDLRPHYDPGPDRVVLRDHAEATGFWKLLASAGLVSQPLAWTGEGPVVKILGEGVSFDDEIDPLVMLETGINVLYGEEATAQDECDAVRIRARIRTLQEMSAQLMRDRRGDAFDAKSTLESARELIDRFEKRDDI